MPLWGRNDAANNAPKYKIEAGTTKTGVSSFGNTDIINGRAVGTFGVDKNEATVSDAVAHPGWVVVRQGTGFLAGLTIADGGADYDNADIITVSGGTTNAEFSVTTDGDGVIVSVERTNPGAGFLNADSANVVITTGAGAGANVVPVMGGRAGRVHMETMVAMGTITGDANDDDIFPDS